MMSRMTEGEWKKDARKGLPSSAANIASLQRNKRHTRERARRLALSFLFPLSPTLSLSDFSSPSSFISQTGPLPTKNKTRSPPQGPERLPSPQALLEQTRQATETDAVASRGKREKNLKDTQREKMTPTPTTPATKRRVHRVRALTSIAEGEEEELPFGLKRVAFAAPVIDVLAFAGGARNVAVAGSNGSSSNGLLSLALGQTAAAARRRPAPQVATPARTVSGFDLVSSGKAPTAATAAVLASPQHRLDTKNTTASRSEPIQIGGSSGAPLRPSSSSSSEATEKRAASHETFGASSEKEAAAAAAAPFEPSLGSWTRRVTFFPLPALSPIPQQQPPVALDRDSMSSQRSSETSGSDEEGSASPPPAGASPKSVLSPHGGRGSAGAEAAPLPRLVAAPPAAKAAAAAAENPASAVLDDAPSAVAAAEETAGSKGRSREGGCSDDPEAEAGWRLRFARRWRRERLYAAIGLFPRSPPPIYRSSDDGGGVDALAAAVVGAFEEADAAVEFGDGEW